MTETLFALKSQRFPDPFDLVVVGDEVESVLTAVSAVRCGIRVALLKLEPGLLGGLSTRGGLSYMDITPERKSPLFEEFLKRAEVKRVALCPQKGSHALETLLHEAEVTCISCLGALSVRWDDARQLWEIHEDPSKAEVPVSLMTRLLIDATPDADVARYLGVPYIEGLGGLLTAGEKVEASQPAPDFLGVTPVFTTTGVDREGLMAFEAKLRARPDMPDLLAQALPNHNETLRQELLQRPVYAPIEEDYIDILNPTIGICFHHWRFGDVASYPTASITIDGFNIARLPNDTLSFNGMVMQGEHFGDLLDYSHGTKPFSKDLLEALTAFETYLRLEGGFPQAKVYVPERLYVRQTLNLLAKGCMTARRTLEGGVLPEEAIGTYSYWLDFRGITLSRFFPGLMLPKPVFNVGLDVAFPPLMLGLQNVAFVGRASGYSPLGQGACRIVQHNAMLGEALAIAAALSLQQGYAFPDVPIRAIQQVLEVRYQQQFGHGLPIDGQSTLLTNGLDAVAEKAQTRLLEADQAIVAAMLRD